MSRLAGKTIIVTGAAHGLGRAYSERLAEEGANVALLDIDGPRNREVAAGIRDRGGSAVAFDCDMIGPMGYCADISRTWLCGPGKPSKQQKALYKLAYEEVHHNISVLKAGMTFREFSRKAFKPRKNCFPLSEADAKTITWFGLRWSKPPNG